MAVALILGDQAPSSLLVDARARYLRVSPTWSLLCMWPGQVSESSEMSVGAPGTLVWA